MNDNDNDNDHDHDHDTDIDDIDTPAMVDPVAAAIALSDLADKLYKLYSLATNSKANKARLRAFAKLNRQIADAEVKRVAIEADAAAIVAKVENEVKAIREDAMRRLDAAAAAEQELEQREAKIVQLENSWRNLGEPADVLSGFRSPQYSPLQKARLAVGQQPGKDPDPLGFAQDAEPDLRIDIVSDTHHDPHADRHGAPFLGELTRDVSHKRQGAA
jgi:hypothetical protein